MGAKARARRAVGRLARKALAQRGLSVTRLDSSTRLLSKSRFSVTRIGTGRTFVLRRKGQPQSRVVELRPGLSVVTDGPGADSIRHTALGDDSWVVGPQPAAGQHLDVSPVDADSWIVTRSKPSPHAEPLLETHASTVFGERHVSWILDRHDIDVVLDVGANVGQFAVGLRERGFTGFIESFEPVPQFADRLDSASSADDRWHVHRLALGTEDGTVPIRVQRTFSSILDASDYGRRRFGTLEEHADHEQVEVQIRRLDSILDDVLAPARAAGITSPRIYLKMDTQGFDLQVFQGMGERIEEVVAMQSEVALLTIYKDMPRLPETLPVYEAAGFELTGCYVVSREPDGRIIEYDCTFVRHGSLEPTGGDDAQERVLA